jgi:predicted nucleic acid-binding protein
MHRRLQRAEALPLSVTWRVPALSPQLRALVQESIRADRMLITLVARMEILHSAQTATEYADLDARLSAFRLLRNDRSAADAAMGALREAADQGGLAVLHRDGHFDRLAEVLAFESVSLPVA